MQMADNEDVSNLNAASQILLPSVVRVHQQSWCGYFDEWSCFGFRGYA